MGTFCTLDLSLEHMEHNGEISTLYAEGWEKTKEEVAIKQNATQKVTCSEFSQTFRHTILA